MKKFQTKGEVAFAVFNYIFLGLVAATCFLPLLNLLALSFSSSTAISAGRVSFWPVDFTMDAYEYAIKNPKFVTAFFVSVKRVVLGVGISMVISVLVAYPLSKDKNMFRCRNIYANILVVTMLIGGGLVPSYMLLNDLHMLNTIWALVLPGALPVYNIILLQNFYRTLPRELEEAAFVDGAGVIRTLWSIFIPLSKPAIATLILFQVVGHWNSWFDGLIYMNRAENYPLQSYLQTIIISDAALTGKTAKEIELLINISSKNLNSAQIFIAMAPILLLFPLLQKHFAKGIVLGSVKG